MKKHLFNILSGIILFWFTIPTMVAQQPDKVMIGQWRDHASYLFSNLLEIADKEIFVSGGFSLYSYDTEDNSINRYSKIDGLSDVGIQTMAYDKKAKTLVIAYFNSNIDLLINGRVYNISDVMRKSIQGDKTIYSITFSNNYAYLACGFGIVVIDLKKKEVKDTYIIGTNSSQIRVNGVAFNDTSILAATEKGILYAGKNNAFLANSENWKPLSQQPSSDSAKDTDCKALLIFGGNMITSLQTGDDKAKYPVPIYSLFVYKDGRWNEFAEKQPYSTLRSNDKFLLVNCRSNIFFYDTSFTLQYTLISPRTLRDAKMQGNSLWATGDWTGLLYYKNYTDQDAASSHYVDGPFSYHSAQVRTYDDKVYVAQGGRTTTSENLYYPAIFSTLSDNQWRYSSSENGVDTITDIVDLTTDPSNTRRIMASSWSVGLMEMVDNKMVNLYNENNSSLRPLFTKGDSLNPVKRVGIRISGSAFDSKQNMWVANSAVTNGLCVRRSNGTWESFNTFNLISNEAHFYAIIVDYWNEYIWLVPKGINKLLVFDASGNGVTVDPNRNNSNNKNPTDNVNCIASDLDGNIWIGTNKGIKVIYDPSNVFTTISGNESAKECYPILYADDKDKTVGHYLLEAENVVSITIDGANRKWIATQNGVYLVSPDGQEQLAHFNKDNSPLPTNAVLSIAVQHQSGEVFFATEEGVVSFKGTATGFGEENKNVYTYPNPVRSGYTGPIAIKGLVQNAIVKITDIAGNVVYNTTSEGGQAIWNGRNMAGKRVASGIYLVFITDQNNEEKAVTKILFLK